MTMMAFDADDPATDNAALRYNIVRQSPGNPSSNMFYIDAERGDIVTAIPAMLLDREVGRLGEESQRCGGDALFFFCFFSFFRVAPRGRPREPPSISARRRGETTAGMIASAAG